MRGQLGLYIVAGFLLGVGIRSITAVSVQVLTMCIVLSALCLLTASVWKQYVFVLAGVALCGACLVIGILRCDAVMPRLNPYLVSKVGAHVVISGYVADEPDIREGSTRLTVDVSSIDGVAVRARVLVVARAYGSVQYGDFVSAEGVLQKPTAFLSGEGRTFNYPMYLAVRNISYELSFARAHHRRISKSAEGRCSQYKDYVHTRFAGGFTRTVRGSRCRNYRWR